MILLGKVNIGRLCIRMVITVKMSFKGKFCWKLAILLNINESEKCTPGAHLPYPRQYIHMYVYYHNIQTLSPLTLKAKFYMNHLYYMKWERNVYIKIQVTRPRWPPCPYTCIRHLKNVFIQNAVALNCCSL